MKQDEFRKWLVEQGQTEASASSRVSTAKRVEQYLGDLDELFTKEDREGILSRFAYSVEDERAERPNPSPVPIDGVLRTGLASLRQALDQYHGFWAEQSDLPDMEAHQALLDQLSRQEIEAATRECDQVGLAAFLQKGGYVDGATQFEGGEAGRTYPAKAVVAAAVGHLPGGRALPMKEFFGGQGGSRTHAVLEKLGYRILHKRRDEVEPTFSRARIEVAMDAYEEFKASGAHADVFAGFDEPKTYWVRSTKPRPDRRFPTKPIFGYLLGKPARALTGGWSQPHDAAARLHAAGYIIVDQDDVPLPVPEQYTHLMRGADRVRLVALNYYLAPAREADMSSVAIRASEVARDMSEQNAFPTICSALGGKKFKDMAGYSALQSTSPNPSSTTTFTFTLDTEEREGNPMEDAGSLPRDQPTRITIETTNLILYGPPGTGKTYRTAWEAVRLCLGDTVAAGLSGEANRDRLMAEYRRLMSEGRIEFVTFHQSMSYEEFVEGLRPGTGEDDPSEFDTGFRLEPVAGIFQRVARRAEASARGGTSSRQDADASQESPEIPDLGAVAPDPTATEATNGDGVVQGLFTVGHLPTVRDGTFRKLAQDVAQQLAEGYPHGFTLDQYREALVRAGRETGIEPTGGWEKHNMPSWASHPEQAWLVPASATPAMHHRAKGSGLQVPRTAVQGQQDTATAHVLIIDEINRANISKVFGELITLLETDKRLWRRDEIQLTLPYSKRRFGVPPNLHIIGTMNTADRSIALLDTALRRRFTFKELMPDPTALSPNVGGINLQKLLASINDRIEYLFDREHQIGHAYFTGCKSREDVDDVMRHKVIPLLSEYFYEDWSKVAAVLGDGPQGAARFLEARRLAAPPGIAADDFSGERLRRRVKDQFDFSEFAA